MAGNSSHHEIAQISPHRFSHGSCVEDKLPGASWYSGRREIEDNSPSRRDGIDLKKETYLRKSYCTFLQDLGMRLKVPQVTIATAVVFCHRFFLRQSHAKSDRRTIATVCMFLAGKVEETPRPLKDVILVSYEIIHKKDPVAVQKIKQREVYEQQKELILIGERLVLATLGFDLNVQHPYKPLVESIKKFKIAQGALAQVAWNFVNDGLRTSLCLQFKPHHIAAGAIFLAAKFLKVRLPSDGDKVWWQEFDVTPRQLEEISNQMLELYEQNRPLQSSHGNDEGSSASGANHRASADVPVDAEEITIPSSGPPSTSTHSQPEQFQSEQHSRIHEPKGAVCDNWDHETGSSNQNKAVGYNEGSKLHSPMMDAMRKIDKDKVKAALEKRRRSRADVSRKMELMDEDDLIERELEHGVELAIEDERNKVKSHNWARQTSKQEPQSSDRVIKMENAEEGELSVDGQNVESPRPNNLKRKATKHFRANDGFDLQHFHAPPSKRQETY